MISSRFTSLLRNAFSFPTTIFSSTVFAIAIAKADQWQILAACLVVPLLVFEVISQRSRTVTLLLAVVTLGLGYLYVALANNLVQFGDTAADSYRAIMQTFGDELIYFLRSYVTFSRRIAVLFAAAFLFLLGLLFFRPLRHPHDRTITIVLVFVLGALGMHASVKLFRAEPVKVIAALKEFEKERRSFEASNRQFSAVHGVSAHQEPLKVIIYIGESTTKWNMGLYGYPRNNTPDLDEISDELVVFSDVIAPHVHTAEAMREVLSSYRFDPLQKISQTPGSSSASATHEVSLLSLLEKGGVSTGWFSNQNRYGIWDNPVTRHSELASHSYFQRKTSGMDFTGRSLDHELITPALAWIGASRPRSALFLHTYAGHWPYCSSSNVPALHSWRGDPIDGLSAAAVWGGARSHRETLNCYDTAISYVSKNVRSVIEWARARQEPYIVVYFSDHGEDVWNNTGHDSSRHTHKQLDIPFLVYFNGAAKTKYPRYLSALRGNREQPVTTTDLLPTLLHLFGISAEGFSQPELSFASEAFITRPRFVLNRDELGYASPDLWPAVPADRDLTDAYHRQKRMLLTLPEDTQRRVCAHRANSLMKFMEASSLFKCVEVDVELGDSGISPTINHLPQPSSRLPLELILRLAVKKKVRMWLDVQDLNEMNVENFLRLLRRETAAFHREDLLIEVQAEMAGSPAVRRLKGAGFVVSYYLPTDEGIRCSDASHASNCSAFKDRVLKDLRLSDFDALSFDYATVGFVEGLPSRPPRIATWALQQRLEDIKDWRHVGKYHMYIVPYESLYNY